MAPEPGRRTSFPPSGGAPAIDLIYPDLGATKKATREFELGQIKLPASIDADLGLDITGWLWTVE